MYKVKDFIETTDGLVFAVVDSAMENGRVLCFLRYLKQGSSLQKLATLSANKYLAGHAAQYLYTSKRLDARLHAVPESAIVRHYQSSKELIHILKTMPPADNVSQDLQALCRLYQQKGFDLNDLGVTGSLLIGAQKPSSDIDLVVYSRSLFHQLRKLNQQLLAERALAQLRPEHWRESYDRRQCALSFDEYCWHERRKFNKALINNRKFDLSWVDPETCAGGKYAKRSFAKITARVTDASTGYDYPARFAISHPDIAEVVSFTATYTGQAETGEWLEAAGWIEQCQESLSFRLVVGSTREAGDEYIKVIGHD